MEQTAVENFDAFFMEPDKEDKDNKDNKNKEDKIKKGIKIKEIYLVHVLLYKLKTNNFLFLF